MEEEEGGVLRIQGKQAAIFVLNSCSEFLVGTYVIRHPTMERSFW